MSLTREHTMLATATLSMLSVLGPAAAEVAETLPPGFPTRRGAFAFANAEVLARPEKHASALEWLANFEVILTNGVGTAARDTRTLLQGNGCKLFLYFWTNGLYQGQPPPDPPYGDWCNDLVQRHRDQLLSSEPLPSLAGIPAYYYDLGNDDCLSRLCEALARGRAAAGYDGIFFDYAGVYALPEEVREVWNGRHRELPYDRAVAAFLSRLRKADPKALIFTNQAYRADEPILANVNYDLAESYATSFDWGPATKTEGTTVHETYFRPWPGEFGIQGLYGTLHDRMRARAPRAKLFFLDYMRPFYRGPQGAADESELDREAVYYSYCAAALWGSHGFCSGWYAGHEYRGPLYFADLGHPLGSDPIELRGAVVREYERGLVALMTGHEPVDVTYALRAPAPAEVYDLFASEWQPTRNQPFRLRMSTSRAAISGLERPSGRVYLKAER